MLGSCIKQDFATFTRLQIAWTIIFAVFSLTFSFVDFNQLTNPQPGYSIFQWVNDTNAGVELWKRILYLFSGIASFTGVLSVVLAAKGRISTFYWGISNCIFYGAFAFAYGYAGDAQLNIMLFLPLQFVGIHKWSRHGGEDRVPPKTLKLKEWVISLLSVGSLWVALYYEIPPFSRAVSGAQYAFQHKPVPHILDAASTGFSVVAQILLLGRFWEQWILWLMVDTINIAMFSGVAYGTDYISINALTMWCFFWLNACFGLCSWFTAFKGAKLHKVITDEAANDYDDSSDAHDDDQLAKREEGSKRYRRGLIVGKFYPIHYGHMYLFNTGIEQCDELYIILCGKPGEIPSRQQREEWLRELYPSSNVYIRSIIDVYDPNDSALWAKLCKDMLKFTPCVAYTSETYGKAWAEHMGCDHVLVDIKRTTYPVSGTLVREHPLRYWEMLSPCVRAYYAKRVVIIGAESTGKSTLAKRLAKELDTVHVLEYGRTYCEAFDLNTKVWTTKDFEMIIKGQVEAERTAVLEANKVLICDTDTLTTTVWYERYMGTDSADLKMLAQQQPKPDLYLLMNLEGTLFVQDGTREMDVKDCPVKPGQTVREWMHEAFLQRVKESGVQFVMLSGKWDERFDTAVQAVRQLLGDAPLEGTNKGPPPRS